MEDKKTILRENIVDFLYSQSESESGYPKYLLEIEKLFIEETLKIQKIGNWINSLFKQFNEVVERSEKFFGLMKKLNEHERLKQEKRLVGAIKQVNFYREFPLEKIKNLPDIKPFGPFPFDFQFSHLDYEYSPRMKKIADLDFESMDDADEFGSISNLSKFQERTIDNLRKPSLIPKNRDCGQMMPRKDKEAANKVLISGKGRHLTKDYTVITPDRRTFTFPDIFKSVQVLQPFQNLEPQAQSMTSKHEIEEIKYSIDKLKKQVKANSSHNDISENQIVELVRIHDNIAYQENLLRLRGAKYSRNDLEQDFLKTKSDLEKLQQLEEVRMECFKGRKKEQNKELENDQRLLRWINVLKRKNNKCLNQCREWRNLWDSHIEKKWLKFVKFDQFIAWKNVISCSKKLQIGQIELIKMCWRSDERRQQRRDHFARKFPNFSSIFNWIQVSFGKFRDEQVEDKGVLKILLKNGSIKGR